MKLVLQNSFMIDTDEVALLRKRYTPDLGFLEVVLKESGSRETLPYPNDALGVLDADFERVRRALETN